MIPKSLPSDAIRGWIPEKIMLKQHAKAKWQFNLISFRFRKLQWSRTTDAPDLRDYRQQEK